MTQDERFDKIDASMERLGERLEHLYGYVSSFRSQVIARLDLIENRLDIISATVANIDARFPVLTKAVLDAGSFATQQLKEQASLANRVAKLEETLAKLLEPAA